MPTPEINLKQIIGTAKTVTFGKQILIRAPCTDIGTRHPTWQQNH